MPKCDIRRLGIRYINALTEQDHKVASIGALNLRLTVGGQEPAGPVLVQARKEIDDLEGSVMLRVASPEFVEGVRPADSVAVIDVDVFTAPGFSRPLGKEITSWLDKAHRVEKSEFFALIPDQILSNLIEE